MNFNEVGAPSTTPHKLTVFVDAETWIGFDEGNAAVCVYDGRLVVYTAGRAAACFNKWTHYVIKYANEQK